MGDMETAWLIEFPMVGSRVMYYGKTVTGLGPTPEPFDAIRFCRKEDAEAIIWVLARKDATAVEHQWIE